MITKMTVDNFKALRHVEVDLEPFTVLIGPNDTGKSSFLEAVYAISESTRSSLPGCFWSPWQDRELVHNQASNSQVRLAVGLKSENSDNAAPNRKAPPIEYSLKLSFRPGRNCTLLEERAIVAEMLKGEIDTRKNTSQTAVFGLRATSGNSLLEQGARRVSECLPQAALARWDVEELAQPSRLAPNRNYPFDPSGYGLATCIAEMKLGTGGNFDNLRKDFCKQFPAFKDIVIQRTTVTSVERTPQFQKQLGSAGEGYALLFVRRDGVEIPAGLASGGTLMTLAFLTLMHLREPRKLLLIEEPENGLHPSRLKEVVQILRRNVQERPDSQVIISTHSPLLLDEVEPEEARVFLRNEHDDIQVHNLARVPDIHERLKHVMLGELVYNEGEEELVKEITEHAGTHPR